MRMAEELAKRSTCARLQVGSVITDARLENVLGIGYNGNAQNLDPSLALIAPPDDLRFVRPRNRYINDAKQFFVKFSYVFRF